MYSLLWNVFENIDRVNEAARKGMCDVMVRRFLLLAEVFDSCQNESAYQKGVNVPQIVFEKIPMLPKAEVTRLVIHFINNTLPLM